MYRYRDIILDFDGTIADSKAVVIRSYNLLADRKNLRTITVDDLETMKELSVLEKCKALNIPIHKIPFIAPEFFKIYREALQEVKPFDGMVEVLTSIYRKDVGLSVISSNDSKIIAQFLLQNQLPFIQDIHCSTNIFGKDRLIQKFLRKKALDRSKVLYIGDEERDIVACRKCGIDVTWVTWGYDVEARVRMHMPDHIAHKPDDLLNIIFP